MARKRVRRKCSPVISAKVLYFNIINVPGESVEEPFPQSMKQANEEALVQVLKRT